MVEPVAESLKRIQIIKRRRHGNPVFLEISLYIEGIYPAMMRNDPIRSGKTAVWKDIIESGVNVYPTINPDLSGHTEIVKHGCTSENPPPRPSNAITLNNRPMS